MRSLAFGMWCRGRRCCLGGTTRRSRAVWDRGTTGVVDGPALRLSERLICPPESPRIARKRPEPHCGLGGGAAQVCGRPRGCRLGRPWREGQGSNRTKADIRSHLGAQTALTKARTHTIAPLSSRRADGSRRRASYSVAMLRIAAPAERMFGSAPGAGAPARRALSRARRFLRLAVALACTARTWRENDGRWGRL